MKAEAGQVATATGLERPFGQLSQGCLPSSLEIGRKDA
jgi:hypothetical protein